MANKQTAVEWIESKLNSVKPTDFCSLQDVKDWVKEAKQMEKEQIEKAFQHSIVAMVVGKVLSPEEYYNETYNKKEDGNL